MAAITLTTAVGVAVLTATTSPAAATGYVGSPKLPGAGPSSAASPSGNTLPAGSQLTAGQALVSPNGAFQFVMQTDGNAVVYGPSGPVYATGTAGYPGSVFTDQTDGNLVVYSRTGHPIWCSCYFATGTTLTMQDDGNPVEYGTGGGVIWASGTELQPPISGNTLHAGQTMHSGQQLTSPRGQNTFVMQANGNAVVYVPDGPVFSTNTYGSGNVLTMQPDGNVVLYIRAGTPLWASGTAGYPGASLVMQDDHNLVVYAADGHPVWASIRPPTEPGPGAA